MGPFLAEQIFGATITNSDNKDVPVRLVAEQHIIEDCGFIPTLQDWLSGMPLKDWMVTGAKPLSKTLEENK